MADLTPAQKSKLQEVADLMLEIYRTLVRMRYLDEEWIQEGPHDISHLMPLYKSQSLDPAIIYLYSILPYVDNAGVVPVDFFQGGEFADFRKKEDVVRGRDPFYNEEEEELMKPWMTPLSLLGNHRSVIIYSARKHCVWIIDQESWSSVDHAFSMEAIDAAAMDLSDDGEGSNGDGGEEDEEVVDDEEGEEEDGDDDNDDEDYDDYDEEEDEAESEGVYDEFDSRPAGDVMRDIVRWYKALKETPGGGENSDVEWSEDEVKPLYIKHGWPSDKFDGDAFEADHARAGVIRELKWRAEEPLRKLQQTQGLSADDLVVRMREQVTAAKSVDEEWLARWKLFQAERSAARQKENRRRAEEEVERLCPDGEFLRSDELPLWEEAQLRKEVLEKKLDLEKALQSFTDAKQKHRSGSAPLREATLRLAYVEKQAAAYQRAYDEAKADAERLCPGKTITSCIGLMIFTPQDAEAEIQRAAENAERSRQELKDIREWAANLPDGAVKAKAEVEQEIERSEGTLKAFELREAAWVKKRDNK